MKRQKREKNIEWRRIMVKKVEKKERRSSESQRRKT